MQTGKYMNINDNNIDEADSLPQLTDKQYKYVEGKVKGLSNTDAWKEAYNKHDSQPANAWRRAADLAANSKVQAWIEHIRQQATTRLVDEESYTLAVHMAELDSVLRLAVDNKAYGPALNAVVAKGKATGKYVEHREINVNNASDLSLIDKLESLLGHDAAMTAASNMGYTPEVLDKVKH